MIKTIDSGSDYMILKVTGDDLSKTTQEINDEMVDRIMDEYDKPNEALMEAAIKYNERIDEAIKPKRPYFNEWCEAAGFIPYSRGYSMGGRHYQPEDVIRLYEDAFPEEKDPEIPLIEDNPIDSFYKWWLADTMDSSYQQYSEWLDSLNWPEDDEDSIPFNISESIDMCNKCDMIISINCDELEDEDDKEADRLETTDETLKMYIGCGVDEDKILVADEPVIEFNNDKWKPVRPEGFTLQMTTYSFLTNELVDKINSSEGVIVYPTNLSTSTIRMVFPDEMADSIMTGQPKPPFVSFGEFVMSRISPETYSQRLSLMVDLEWKGTMEQWFADLYIEYKSIYGLG